MYEKVPSQSSWQAVCVTIGPVHMDGEDKSRTLSQIAESLCIGCAGCVHACPFSAIQIVKLPKALDGIVHKYAVNGFQLHNLPLIRPGTVLGLLGSNGIGKSTVLRVLSGAIVPNFNKHTAAADQAASQKEVIKYFAGTEMQQYLRRLYSARGLTVAWKQQAIDVTGEERATSRTAAETLCAFQTHASYQIVHGTLELAAIAKKPLDTMSGGELQRLRIAVALLSEADVYCIDEFCNFLDSKQRMSVANLIQSVLLPQNKYVIVVEHDLSILDYVADHVCCLYGQPGAYGIVTAPFTANEGINVFLSGYNPIDNVRFRKDDIDFKFTIEKETPIVVDADVPNIAYPLMRVSKCGFDLTVMASAIPQSQITCLLGENGTGKTTFIKMLCGHELLNVSYKPQIIAPKWTRTVRELFDSKADHTFYDPWFQSTVVKPLHMQHLLDLRVQELSGGELQKVAIVLALAKPADLYCLDEPSANLDCGERLSVSRVIKRFILASHKTCCVVEHDFIMATYLADHVIVFHHTNAERTESVALPILDFNSGFNLFLKELDVTFRRDTTTLRPRINKAASQADRDQKKQWAIFFHHCMRRSKTSVICLCPRCFVRLVTFQNK